MTALAVGFASHPARAARVEGLYTAEAPLSGESAAALNDAFADALGQVLVKVTGRREIAQDQELLERIGNPRALVEQFRLDRPGRVRARFDRVALKHKLDQASQPIWGSDRPETLLWLAIDRGQGRREMLGPPSGMFQSPTLSPDTQPGPMDPDFLRRRLLQVAAARGVPLLFPLLDSQDLAAVSIADIWGGFTEPVRTASQRYGADAVLIGRARLFDAGPPLVHWTLLLGSERFEWNGDMAEGPQGLADRLASTLATSVTGTEQIKLSVSGIDTLSQYAAVATYLKAMAIIQSCAVHRVSTETVVFELTVRGDRNRLARTLALRHMLLPVAASSAGGASVPSGQSSTTNGTTTGRWPVLSDTPPDLKYRLAQMQP